MIKFLTLDFLVVSHRISCTNKNAVYRFQVSASVLEIFKFEKKEINSTDKHIELAHFFRKYQLDLETAKKSNFSKLAKNEAVRALATNILFKDR